MEIKGSHILITGANRGIGKAVALMCAEDKAHLHIVIRNEDPELKKELLDAGAVSVEIYRVDLSQAEQIDQLISQLKDTPIDVLINNAGQLTGGLLESQNMSEIYAMLQVNVNALIHLTHGILPGMLARNRGKIVNQASVAGVMHFPCSSTYSAAKSAVIAFTNSLRAELSGTKVSTLLLVTPGVDTKMFKEIPKLYGQNLSVNFLKAIPAKKYARMIREAILEDLPILKPHGLTGAGLAVAQYLPKVFENIVLKRFKRE